jgi:Flp pilus assembly protein TadG
MLLSARPVHRRGIAAPYVAMSLIVLVGMLALTIDGGVLMSERRRGQAAADAAALAAASDLFLQDQVRTDHSKDGQDTAGTARTSAHTTSAANGYVYTGSTTTATVNIPPLSGAFSGKAHYAEVLVQYNNKRSFSRIWGSSPVPTTARAVARGLMTPYTNAGIIVLNPTASKSLRVSGNGDLNVKSGAIIVDSSAADAAFVVGNGTLIGSEVDITGNDKIAGNGGITTDPPGQVYTGKPPTPDPLAGLAAPDPSTLPTQSGSNLNVTNGATLQPGRYYGGVDIGGGKVTLQPGIYYMDHGSFSMNKGTLNGTGVMIYNDTTSGFKLTGGTYDITAPTSGPYVGIAFWQARGSNTTISITGQGQCNLIGTVYAPDCAVSVTGGGGVTIGSMFISDTLKLAGNGGFTVDWKGAPVPGKRDIRLVE